jgi:hypothetical protein
MSNKVEKIPVAINTITSLIEHKEFMEFLRLGVVYVHLVACCVAIGLVLTSDIAMVRDLLKRKTFTEHDLAHMESLQKSVVLALIALWVTGTAIIGIDYLGKGLEYFENPKLHAKVIIVILLTYNGILLHRLVLPALQKAGSLLELGFSARMMALVLWFAVRRVLDVCRHARSRSPVGLEVLALRAVDGVSGAYCAGLPDDVGVDSASQATEQP